MSFGFRMVAVAAILLITGGIFVLTVRRTSSANKQDEPKPDSADTKSVSGNNVLPFKRPTDHNK